MLWLIAGSAAALASSPSAAQARAMVRIESAPPANREEWERRSSSAQRREIIIDDGQGRKVRVRLFEYQ